MKSNTMTAVHALVMSNITRPTPEAIYEDPGRGAAQGGTPGELTELELDPPKASEVLIQMEAGPCHCDEHIRARGTARLPPLLLHGSLFGGAKPLYDIPMILGLWHEGHIKLTELITKK